MQNEKHLKGLLDQVKVFSTWIASGIINAGFLALWVFVQSIASQFITPTRLPGIDSWVLTAFTYLFAVSTLAPVLFWVLGSIAIMAIRTLQRIRKVVSDNASDLDQIQV